MLDFLRRLFRPTLTRRTVTTTRKQGAITYTSAAPQFHFTLFGSVAVNRTNAPRKPTPPKRTPIKDALFGKVVTPLTDAQARALPGPHDALTLARTLTGDAYPGRTAVQAAQARAVRGATAYVNKRVAAQPTVQLPGRKPIQVKAHVRDGVRVAAHTRARAK